MEINQPVKSPVKLPVKLPIKLDNITTPYEPNYYRDIVVLYCPEKVGSTSIATSIRVCASDKFMVLHTHENKIADIINQGAHTINVSDIVLNSQVFNPYTNSNRKIYLIDIYRTPIERKISYFFQKISEEHFNNTEQAISQYPMEKLIKRFNDIFPHIKETDYFNECFNTMNPITEFDYEKKYVVKILEGVNYIKLRLQDSNSWGEILSNLLGVPITLIHDYDTTKKEIGQKYKEFVKAYKIPYNYYKMIESESSLSIYMSESEKKTYLKKWFEKSSKPHNPFTTQEYEFYKLISNENKYYCANTSNKHYGDDGCLCERCCNERAIILNKINEFEKNRLLKKQVEAEPIEMNIRHKYDSTYNNNLYLKLFPYKDKTRFVEIMINLINS